MRSFLSVTLVAACVLSINAQAQGTKGDVVIGIQKAMGELLQIPKSISLIEESDNKIKASDQVQSETLIMLKRQEDKIRNEEAPALQDRINRLVEFSKQQLNSGCSADVSSDLELVKRCNAANDQAGKERDEIQKATASIGSRMDLIRDGNAAVYATTTENFEKRKQNRAALADLQARKTALQKQIIAGSMSFPKSQAAARTACKSLPLETAHCCLSVANDSKTAAECDVELLFKVFQNAGVFSTPVVRPVKQ